LLFKIEYQGIIAPSILFVPLTPKQALKVFRVIWILEAKIKRLKFIYLGAKDPNRNIAKCD
jgi:hypothetical protein